MTNQNSQNIALVKELEETLKTHLPKKRVLLVDANLPLEANTPYRFGSKSSSGFTPFGLNRIVSYLTARNVDCKVKPLMDVAQEDLSNSDIIGIHSLSPSIPAAFEFARKTKQKYPNKTIIGGGEHFGLDYKWILENQQLTGVDACGTMQGELPLLALSLGLPIEKIGSLAYIKNKEVVLNPRYPRLTEAYGLDSLLAPSPVLEGIEQIVVPELAPFFNGAVSTQTSSGCNHACTFCTNGRFYGKAVSTIEIAKREIESAQQGVDFIHIRDPMLNTSSEHLQAFVKYMQKVNEGKRKFGWYSFMSATPQLPDFKELSKAGAVMLGVGIEDVVGDRRELGKGSNLDAATRFIDSAKEYLAVRALLLLGLPNHYHLPKEEIKQRMLTYMKDHPQAVYRINILTPTPGTIDYENYANALIDNPHQNPAFLSKFDNMHSLVDPRRMREKLGITNLDNNQDYVQTPQDWEELRKEITLHYLGSEEHARFIESLKGKEVLGKQDLLYNITRKFKEINN